MAATHTYTLVSNLLIDDQVVVTGTVDGTPVIAYGWLSAMAGLTQPQKLTYILKLMIDAAAPHTIMDLTSMFPSSVTA